MVRWEVTGQVWGTRAVVRPHMDMWLVGRAREEAMCLLLSSCHDARSLFLAKVVIFLIFWHFTVFPLGVWFGLGVWGTLWQLPVPPS